jgi:hypothetical protein
MRKNAEQDDVLGRLAGRLDAKERDRRRGGERVTSGRLSFSPVENANGWWLGSTGKSGGWRLGIGPLNRQRQGWQGKPAGSWSAGHLMFWGAQSTKMPGSSCQRQLL